MNSNIKVSADEAPNVLYIMGTGRSGSTILEIVLGSAKETFGTGELFNILKDGYLKNSPCSCDQEFNDCKVWSSLKASLPLSDDETSKLIKDFSRLEWHSGFWLQWFGISTPNQQYFEINQHIIRTLKEITGSKTIIDSSKYAGRVLALNKLLGNQLKVIWLVRKPENIITSFQKKNKGEQLPKSSLKAAIYIFVVTLSAKLVQKKLGNRCLLVHYEDFISNPQQELSKISSWANIDLEESIEKIKHQKPFSPGHLVTANRLRQSKEIILKVTGEKTADPKKGAQSLITWGINIWYKMLRISRLA